MVISLRLRGGDAARPDAAQSMNFESHGRWWRESEVLVLIALVIGAYFIRAADLTIRGEESRWATVAREMTASGDWVVPRQQGEPFLSRPPLGNWLIALATLVRGECDAWAIRLPTVLAVLLTTLLVYAIGRTFLNRLGAFTAALAFCTMGEVLQMGRVAETDLVFTGLLSSAVLVWLCGERRGWPDWLTWSAGYGLAALAALAKGPQAPVYFVGTTVIYLLNRRDWRMLLSRAHVFGFAVFVAVVAAWQVPFLAMAGWKATYQIWTGDSTARFADLRFADVLIHLVRYPLEVLGCMAPWSLFLVAFASRQFRRSLGELQPQVTFLSIYFILGFLPCWLSPGGMTRYCLPLYPAAALLVGVVADRMAACALSNRLSSAWRAGWRFYAASMSTVAVGVLVISIFPVPAAVKPWAQSTLACIGIVVAAGFAAGLALRVAGSGGSRALRAGVLALSGFMAMNYGLVIVNALVARSGDTATAIARLKETLPPDVRLVSFNPTHHLFAYHYGLPIELRPWPNDADAAEWFCFCSLGEYRPALPFCWTEVMVVPVDRNWHAKPENVVVVGRRASRVMTAGR